MSVYAGYLKQLELMGRPRDRWPDIRWLVDPTDYLKPIVFDVNDKAWLDTNKDGKFNQLCGAGDLRR